jgi:hypothetical protein
MAEIEFDLNKPRFVGTICYDDGVDVFYSQSHTKLNKEFRKAIGRVKQKIEIVVRVRRQVVPLMDIIQSGETSIVIDESHSDQSIFEAA